MVPQSHFLVCFLDVLIARFVSLVLKLKNRVEVTLIEQFSFNVLLGAAPSFLLVVFLGLLFSFYLLVIALRVCECGRRAILLSLTHVGKAFLESFISLADPLYTLLVISHRDGVEHGGLA